MKTAGFRGEVAGALSERKAAELNRKAVAIVCGTDARELKESGLVCVWNYGSSDKRNGSYESTNEAPRAWRRTRLLGTQLSRLTPLKAKTAVTMAGLDANSQAIFNYNETLRSNFI